MLFIKDNVERVTESEAVAAKLISLGFKAIDLEGDDTAQKGEKENVSIQSMTMPELKALAKEKGIEGAGSLNKEELLAVLKDVV